MKAIVCDSYGPPQNLKLLDLPDPEPARGQVVVDVKAAGVNFPDTLIIQGKYQFKPPPPFSPGGEIAGVIRKVGEGVSRFREGDRVIAILGWGGFAEQVLADEHQLVPIPDGMDFADAAAFLFAYGTSHYALKDRATIKPGESLLVLGAAGGVGIAAVELGKLMGARVIAAASSAEKLAFCREHGADEVINYSEENLKDRIRALTGGEGADVVYDPVGGPYSEPAIRATAWYGRYLVVGFAAGEIPKIPLNLTLLKSCSITGVFWGAFTARDPQRNAEHFAELMGWWREGKLKPAVSATYPLARVPDALQDMLDRKVKGKAVITI